MTLTLLHPWFLLAAVCIGLVWLGGARTNSYVHGAVRTALLALLAIGLARPMLIDSSAKPTYVYILDQTASVLPNDAAVAREHVRALAQQVTNGQRILINLGSELDDDLRTAFDRTIRITGNGPDGTSPLTAALARAAACIPADAGGCVVVASDGLSTRNDDGRWLANLRDRNIPLHAIPLDIVETPRPVDLRWHDELRVGTTAELTVILAGNAGAGRVVMEDDGGVLASTEFDQYSGRTELPVRFEPAAQGFHDVRVRLEGLSGDPLGNALLERTLPIQPPRRLLYMGSRQRDGANRLGELIGDGFDVVESRLDDPGVFREQLAQAELVVLDDVAADDVPTELQEEIARAVTDDGLGVMMSGGRSSFAAGGWHDTPIESILPVELVQKEEKRDPSTTLVVVIDTSGSMSGQRVQLAKEVARLAIRRLMPHDKVGLVEFYGAKRWAAPIQPASNAIEIERAINRLDAGGGTVILPAIEESFYGLQNVDTRYKHVLVLTDGGVEAGAFEPLLRRMAAEGINTSTVLVGGGIHSEFLVNLANWGKGRFYSVPDRFNLPEIIFKQPSSAKLPSYKEGSHAVTARAGAGWWGDVDVTILPELRGYVETRARPRAEVLLSTQSGNHPITATWRYGLGRVSTFASEPTGAGTAGFNDWPDYGRMMARILERTAADGRSAFRFSVDHDGADIVITAQRVVPDRPGLRPILQLREDGELSEVVLTRRSPDTWQARLLSPEVNRRIEFEGRDTGGLGLPPTNIVGESSVVAEFETDPHEGLALDILAGVTGGSVIDRDALTTPSASTARGIRAYPLAPWVLATAMLMFIGDVAWRRRP